MNDQHQSAPILPSTVASASQQSIVVVLGMHRSGTSLLANLLHVLGVDLGDNLLPADGGNEAGYWEQNEIFQTQDELLKCLGRSWSSPTGTVPFPDAWCRLPEVAPFKSRLISILRKEIGQARGLWGFKDPRTSRLLPLWSEIFAELGLEPLYLLAIREPASVVESVARRDEIPRSRAELLWLLHNLDAVRDAGEQLRLVIDYDRWFTEPHEQAHAVVNALGFSWPSNEEELLASVRQQIRPNLRHHRAPSLISLPFVSETYHLLQQAAATGQIPASLRQLDTEARRAMALLEPWASVVADQTRPVSGSQFSFVDNYAGGRLEPLSETGQAAVWDVKVGGNSHRSFFLHPPARLRFSVSDGRRARMTFATAMHPDAWDKPDASGCEFTVLVDGVVCYRISLDPANVPSDRRWHECVLDIPENSTNTHEVLFETNGLDSSLTYCWAMWREPRMLWEDGLPEQVPVKPRAPRMIAEPQANPFDARLQAPLYAKTARQVYDLLLNHSAGKLLKGKPDQTAIWEAKLDGGTDKAIFLLPPAELMFEVPTGARGSFLTAVAIHPDAWDKLDAGGCEFHLRIDGRLVFVLALDPTHLAGDRHWHVIQLEVPENASGNHQITLETRAIGSPQSFRWALWRAPQFKWLDTKEGETPK